VAKTILRRFLIFGGGYFLFEGLLHLSGLKLSSINSVWPIAAISYANLLNNIYASFIILAGFVAFIIQKDPIKYELIIKLSAIWALLHGIMLLFLVWTQDYQQIFQNLPSLLVYLPFYREYLIFNAVLLFLYSGVVYFYFRTKK